MLHFIEVYLVGAAGFPDPDGDQFSQLGEHGAAHALVQAYESVIAVQQRITEIPPRLEGRIALQELRLQCRGHGPGAETGAGSRDVARRRIGTAAGCA